MKAAPSRPASDEWDEDDAEPLLLDGFEKALIGFGTQFDNEVAIYEFDRCVAILVKRDGMSRNDAMEYLEFNTAGAWVGPHTPILLRTRVKAGK